MTGAPSGFVVRGAGAITAFGDVARTLAALDSGQCAIATLDGDAPRARAAVADASDVHVPLPRELDPQVKFLSGSGRLLVDAAHAAAAAAGLVPDEAKGHRRGLYLAQMDAGDWDCHDFVPAIHAVQGDAPQAEPDDEAINRASLRVVKPFFLLESLKNNAFSFVGSWFDLRGPNTSSAGTASTGLVLLDMALRALERGTLDMAVYACGARLTPPFARHERALAHAARTPPPAPPGDGAAMVVLERADGAAPAGCRLVALAVRHAPFGLGAEEPPHQVLAALLKEVLRARADAPLAGLVLTGLTVAQVAPALASAPATSRVPVLALDAALGHTGLAGEGVALALLAAAAGRGSLPAPGGGAPTPWPVGGAVVLLAGGGAGSLGAVLLVRDGDLPAGAHGG
jgi:hypothetical protein